METMRLDEGVFRKLRDFIYEKTGIFINDSKRYLLENRLQRRIIEKGLSSYEEYLYLIQYNPNSSELRNLFDAITTNETYFFREPQHFDVLFGHIINNSKDSTTKRLRIWSAGCSTGEEPYTIAMLMKEKNIYNPLSVEIVGTDLNETVLESAKKAIYSSYSVRNVPAPYLKKYFKEQAMTYHLKDEIKETVRFKKVNLVDEHSMRRFRDFDIIFCRNVLIYFDEKSKKKVLSMLYDALKHDGYLFLGASESLHNVTRAFKPIAFNKTVVYKRG